MSLLLRFSVLVALLSISAYMIPLETLLALPGAAWIRSVLLEIRTGFTGSIGKSSDGTGRSSLSGIMIGSAEAAAVLLEHRPLEAGSRLEFPAACTPYSIRTVQWDQNDPQFVLKV